MSRPLVLLVHGGAGRLPDESIPNAVAGVEAAARAGMAVLLRGGSALDAVEAATIVMEDRPHFNAGYGSVLNRDGAVEMDALLVEGDRLRMGACSLVRSVKNPIRLARAILEHTPHTFLAGAAADAVAVRCGLETVPNEALITDARRTQLRRLLETSVAASAPSFADPIAAIDPSASAAAVVAAVDAGVAALPSRRAKETVLGMNMLSPPPIASSAVHATSSAVGHPAEVEVPDAGDHDTVGVVAIDADGNVAAATSTGGLSGKWAGRVGDTPILGAGGYADNESGAVSTTGTGEFIMRFGLARAVASAYERLAAAAPPGTGRDELATAAVEEALRRMKERLRGDPGEGVIFVSRDGGVGIGHSSARMSYAAAVSAGASAEPEVRCGVQLQGRRYEDVYVLAPAST